MIDRLYSSACVSVSEVTWSMATGTEEASRRMIMGGEMSGGSALTTVCEIAATSASAPARLVSGCSKMLVMLMP